MIVFDPSEDFSIQKTNLDDQSIDEEQIVSVLAEKVAAYLRSNPDLLMSYLYRLDVQEIRIQRALENAETEPANVVLAKLIWTRQKERLQTRKKYKSKNNKEWWHDF